MSKENAETICRTINYVDAASLGVVPSARRSPIFGSTRLAGAPDAEDTVADCGTRSRDAWGGTGLTKRQAERTIFFVVQIWHQIMKIDFLLWRRLVRPTMLARIAALHG